MADGNKSFIQRVNPYKPSVLFMGHRRTEYTQPHHNKSKVTNYLFLSKMMFTKLELHLLVTIDHCGTVGGRE